MDLQSQKTISLLLTITISLNIQIDKFFYRSDLETTILEYFLSKSLNYSAIILFLQKFSTLTIAKFNISARTEITLQTIVKKMRAITMCSAFTLIVGMTMTLLFSLRTCYVHIQSVLVNFACTEDFQFLGRSEYRCSQCASACQVHIFPFEDQTNSFLLSLGQGVYIFEESPNSVQDVFGDVYWPGKY